LAADALNYSHFDGVLLGSVTSAFRINRHASGQRTISAVTDSSIGRNLSNPHDDKVIALLVTADAAGAMKK
jgi:hypothetical protein